MPVFDPSRVHLLLRKVYGDLPCHNDESLLNGGVKENVVWQRCWCYLDARLASWYAMLQGVMGWRFMAILAAELWGVLDWS